MLTLLKLNWIYERGGFVFELIFHPQAQQEILALDSPLQGKAFAALDKLETQSHQLRYPHTDIIQDGLFELRAGKKR